MATDEYTPSKRATFLYFAYGSNLWTKRIHHRNPTAVRKGIAELKGHRLDFYTATDVPPAWNGASATITEDSEYSVWGAVYEIDLMQMASLDFQELCHINKYVPIIKEVVTPEGETLECRVYQMVIDPVPLDPTKPDRPHERKPSKSYLDVIIRGAEESKLPEKYVSFLKKIVHNNCEAQKEFLDLIFGDDNKEDQ